MKAIVTRLESSRQRREKVLVADWSEPDSKLTGTDILIRTLYSGITNGTERNDLLGGVYATPDDGLPAGNGYQNVGEVIAIGSDVEYASVGDIVFSYSDHTELARIDENMEVVVLPASVDPTHASLFGMASVALRAVACATPEAADRVLVVGDGVLGQVAMQLVALRGAHVTLAGSNEERLEIARSLGVTDVTIAKKDWNDAVADSSFDHVFDFAGAPEDDLVSAVAQRGSLTLMAGRFRFDYPFFPGQVRSITIRQDTSFDRGDLHAMSRLVAKGLIRLGPLVKDVVPVTEADRIYRTLRDRPRELFGTVFDWRNS